MALQSLLPTITPKAHVPLKTNAYSSETKILPGFERNVDLLEDLINTE